VDNSPVLTLYKHIKPDLKYEQYLDVLPSNLRFFITRFRISAHSLRIQTGRYARNRLDRNLRVCQLCQEQDVEDEFHVILKCPLFTSLRKKYVKKNVYDKPSVFKLIEMFKSKDKQTLTNLALYLKEALNLRIAHWNQM